MRWSTTTLPRLDLLVIQLEGLGTQRLDVGDLRARLELELLLGGNLLARGNHDHVAVLAHVQALGVQDDRKRLVPGNVLQAQREAALHGIAGDDVQVREVGDDLQQRTHVDVLEVQRKPLALVAWLRAGDQPVRILAHRLDLDDELRVALVGVVLPLTLRLDHQPRVVALLEGAHGAHRRTEVADVQAPAQIVGQFRADEIDDDRLPLLADVDAHARVGQIDDDTTFAFLAAPEVDVAQRVLALAVSLGEAVRRRGLRGRRSRGSRLERDDERVAVDRRLVAHRPLQVQHDPRAIA